MFVINANNINTAVPQGLIHLLNVGLEEPSRNGLVLVAPGPVTTIYNNPRERVLFSSLRDANPFFHVMEALWMLSGRNDIAFPRQFNKRFGEYSDDGKIGWGAYGWRWREFFGYDQLEIIIDELKKNPASRRCVLSMWNGFDEDPTRGSASIPSDLYVAMNGGKDVPCNTHAYFDCRGGKLNMTVCNRSNDAVWGAYGANVVHFSFLQEYMAEQIGIQIGVYRQISNNFHAYLDVYPREKLLTIAVEARKTDMYNIWPALAAPYPLGSTDDNFTMDLELFLDNAQIDYMRETFFSQIVGPMHTAWFLHKEGQSEKALEFLTRMPHCDWKVAAASWIERRTREKKDAA